MSDDPDFEYLMSIPPSMQAHQHAAGARKRGLEDQALGHSRGGLSTKNPIWPFAAWDHPVRFTLTAGQKGRCAASLCVDRGIARRGGHSRYSPPAYDPSPPSQYAAKGAIAVIPSTVRHERSNIRSTGHLYAQRHLVVVVFSKLKQFRRVAARFEKTARNYRAVVTLAAIILWMR